MTSHRYPVRITVRPDPAVNDPQGNTVREGLHTLGHEDVADVRVGKVVELDILSRRVRVQFPGGAGAQVYDADDVKPRPPQNR